MSPARLGPSFVLSLLCVAAAAVALRRPEPAPGQILAVTHPEPPAPTPGVPWPGDPAPAATTTLAAEPPPAGVRPAARPHPAPSAFTEVRPGESLADVATRVYGTTDAVATLWRANRDRLERADAPVRVGTLLRTP